MYFVVIMAFAFVLSDGLPPERFNLLAEWPTAGPLAVVAGQCLLVGLVGANCRKRVLAKLDGTELGHETAADELTHCHHVLLAIIAVSLIVTMVLTPWAPLVRGVEGLRQLPLLSEIVILAPFFACVTLAWVLLYHAEIRIREEAMALDRRAGDIADAAQVTRPALFAFLIDKFRHQILIIAAPLSLIVIAKFFTVRSRAWVLSHHLPFWIPDSALGMVSIGVLLFSPVILRFVWSTQRLPDGPLRDRFVRTCRRIGLRYREILLWRTHGMAVNAAVMGFVPRLRYILVSDALLQTMSDEEIEAVFGHEAGHVQHWHLHFFALFALLSSYVAGSVFFLLGYTHLLSHPDKLRRLIAGNLPRPEGPMGLIADQAILGLIMLAALLACWLFGFGWISRKFERQADLFGVRCITPDIKSCANWCPVHGTGGAHEVPSLTLGARGLCISAAHIFGRTLLKIADLNGIPRHAPSWRHGSIDSRCNLIERFSKDPSAVRRFDRSLWRMKAVLLGLSLIGTAVAAWLYYLSVEPALKRLLSWLSQHAS